MELICNINIKLYNLGLYTLTICSENKLSNILIFYLKIEHIRVYFISTKAVLLKKSDSTPLFIEDFI